MESDTTIYEWPRNSEKGTELDRTETEARTKSGPKVY